MKEKIKELKEGRKRMKTMGKWTALFLLVFALVGCYGGGGGSSSSDEDPVTATENPIVGTWKVTVDPQNQDLIIEPVTLGATGYPIEFINDETHNLPVGVAVNLAKTRVVNGSVEVYGGPGKTGTKYAYPADYTYTLGNGTDPATITNAGGAIGDGDLVYVSYKAFKCNDCVTMDLALTVTDANVQYSDSGGLRTTTADIIIQNNSNKSIEEIRSYTGMVAGPPGWTDIPKLWNSSYPLLVGDTPNNTTTVPVDGWIAGRTYFTRGNWKSATLANPPAVRGAPLEQHPDSSMWMPEALSPVCGRMSNTWVFSESQSQYKFYMQLSGTPYNWIPDMTDPNFTTQDPRWDPEYFITYYVGMAYLAPSGGADNTWCTDTNNSGNRWHAGFLGKIRPQASETGRCGTLITDPRVPAGTFIALNFGIEYPDFIETMGQTFWDTYATVRQPKTALAVGAPYIYRYSWQAMFDGNVLVDFGSGPQSTGSGTYFEGSFIEKPYTNTTIYFQGGNPYINTKFGGGMAPVRGGPSATGKVYWASARQPATGSANQFEFFGFQGITTGTYLYVTRTPADRCTPLTNMPRWAAQWGLAHYEDGCTFVTEGADSEIDLWMGMLVVQVNETANPGDWSFIRYDRTGNNNMYIRWNNKTASDYNAANAYEDVSTAFCWRKSVGQVTCPAGNNLDFNDYVVFKQNEVGNGYLPPGTKQIWPAWNAQCKTIVGSEYADRYTCGGRQAVHGVVCVQ